MGRRMNRQIPALLIAAFSLPAYAQTAPNFMSPTTISSAGSYPSTGINVSSPANTAVIELQATGSGMGLSFSVTGTPIGSTTAVTLKMYTAPACDATMTSGTANGDWFVPVAGFTNIKLVVASVTGSETFGITASNQPNCANVAGAPVTTTPSGSGTASAPYKVTPVNLDATSLSGSGATTILSAGHAAAGASVTASVAYCININGTAGSTNGTPAGTWCGGANAGFAAGQPFVVPPTGNAVSMYGLSAGTASGTGAQ